MSSIPPSPNDTSTLPDPGDGPVLLTAPRDGVPDVVETQQAYLALLDAMAGSSGALAIDAERAHGFRYSQRAYLIQLRRVGYGTALIDPVALAEEQQQLATDSGGARRPSASSAASAASAPRTGQPASGGRRRTGLPGPPADLSALTELIGDDEWVVHAASQDLPCLVEIGLVPHRIFDTELAGRLLGYPRVNLGTLLEELLGFRLLKEHSASDWSIRPLPAEWLTYAALDVELLIELRDVLASQLEATGKSEWARQEFGWLAEHAEEPREPRVDPWRRTSGIHRIRNPRGLAIVAELWQARDAVARRTDRAPARILPDSAVIDIAAHRAPSARALQTLPSFAKRPHRRYETNWIRALETALALPESDLPPMHRHSEAPPQSRMWLNRDPVAAARLQRIRTPLTARAAELNLPVENLLTPDFLRRIAWTPPTVISPDSVDDYLRRLGARAWQREIVVPLITGQLAEPT